MFTFQFLGVFDPISWISLISCGSKIYWIYVIQRFHKFISTQLLVMFNNVRVTYLVAPRVEPAAQPKHDWDTDLRFLDSTNYYKPLTKINMRPNVAQPVWSHLKFCYIFLLNRGFFAWYDFVCFRIVNFRIIHFRNDMLRCSRGLNRVEPGLNITYTCMHIIHISLNVTFIDFYSHCIIIKA